MEESLAKYLKPFYFQISLFKFVDTLYICVNSCFVINNQKYDRNINMDKVENINKCEQLMAVIGTIHK